MATTDTSNSSLRQWHVALIEELGFTNEQAEALADARTSVLLKAKSKNETDRRYEQRVDHHLIRKMMDRGATHEQVIAILT